MISLSIESLRANATMTDTSVFDNYSIIGHHLCTKFHVISCMDLLIDYIPNSWIHNSWFHFRLPDAAFYMSIPKNPRTSESPWSPSPSGSKPGEGVQHEYNSSNLSQRMLQLVISLCMLASSSRSPIHTNTCVLVHVIKLCILTESIKTKFVDNPILFGCDARRNDAFGLGCDRPYNCWYLRLISTAQWHSTWGWNHTHQMCR